MNHTCITEYLLEQSMKMGMLKTIFCCPVSIYKKFTEKKFELLVQLYLVSFCCFDIFVR